MVSRARAEQIMEKFVNQLEWRLDDDNRNEIPTDAATLGIIKGFLKDNDITIAASDDQLAGVRKGLKEQEEQRRRIREERKQKALELVKADQRDTGT